MGIGFLGRPRSLRAAAAEEAGGRTLLGLMLLAVPCLPLALEPGLVLAAMQPVVALLAPGAPALPLNYAPLPLALLMLAIAGAAWLGLRRYGVRGAREAAAWNGGFGKPPVWLPFGDPLTQPSGTGFAEPVRAVLGRWALTPAGSDYGEALSRAALRRGRRIIAGLAGRRGGGSTRQHLAVVFGALLVFLLALGLGRQH